MLPYARATMAAPPPKDLAPGRPRPGGLRLSMESSSSPMHERPNELEQMVLARMAMLAPDLESALESVRVWSRELTGVGSFTNFLPEAHRPTWDRHIGIDAPIHVPGLQFGLDAILFCRGDRPELLELVTFGGEPWDGSSLGFRLGGPPDG